MVINWDAEHIEQQILTVGPSKYVAVPETGTPSFWCGISGVECHRALYLHLNV